MPKTVVFDSPYQDEVAIVDAGVMLKAGEPKQLPDAKADICLGNPHVRLESEDQTPFQREHELIKKSEQQLEADQKTARARQLAKRGLSPHSPAAQAAEAAVSVAATVAPVSAATNKE